MKRTDLIKRLNRMAKDQGVDFAKIREGGSHEVWQYDTRLVTIPRHREINELTANGIIRTCKEEGQ